MKNQYLFFESQDFADADLTGFAKTDTPIAKTPVHIYEFEYQSAEETDELEAARKLDELTKQFADRYPDKFQTILSESSQFFCGKLYPLVVRFETTLRRVYYITKVLSSSGCVNKETLLVELDKKKKTTAAIEELDFGTIYDAIFTDQDFKNRFLNEYRKNLTKADVIKTIKQLEEVTLWRKLVGSMNSYIENSFLLIEEYRNHVMHSHLINYETFVSARSTFEKANEELNSVINEKLIKVNSSTPSSVDLLEGLKAFLLVAAVAAKKYNRVVNSEEFKSFARLAREWQENMQLLREAGFISNEELDKDNTTDPQEDEDGTE